ncbi:MAG: 4'-phosphopantetheinyl transferase superfamily protein [Nitrospira sp.]|nr:4'-phosphopantetheinyl transferase superfamily protein [Nitrospira sp.]
MLIAFQPIERITDTSLQHHIRLEPNAVHLWGIELDGPSLCLERCAGWLDEVEGQRAARLVREDLRRHYVLAHGGLRAVLGKYLGVAPGHIAIDRTITGKPFLTKDLQDRSAITFNLSHAHGRALVAVSRAQEVGIDLEPFRSDIQVENLSRRYFTQSEHTTIMQSAPDQRPAIFFRYWVAKEAVLKAQGIGLSGLTGCEITLGADGVVKDVRVRVDSRLLDPLRVQLLSCEPGWEAAVSAHNLDRVKQCDSGTE